MKARRSLTCIAVCVVMAVCMSLSVSAHEFEVNGATVTYTFYIARESCTSTISINKYDVSTAVTVTLVGTYCDSEGNLITSTKHSSGTTGATATVSNNGGSWVSITSTFYGKYAGTGDSVTIIYPG